MEEELEKQKYEENSKATLKRILGDISNLFYELVKAEDTVRRIENEIKELLR